MSTGRTGFGISAAELLEQPPPNFKFPSNAERVQGVVQGIGAVLPVVNKTIDQGGIVTPPVAAQISSLAATISGVNNKDFQNILQFAGSIQSLTNAVSVSQTSKALADLVTSGIAVTSTVLGIAGQAAAAADAAKVVPVLGSMLSALMAFGEAITISKEEWYTAQAECQQRIDNILKGVVPTPPGYITCKQVAAQSTPRATAAYGYAPSDPFRQLAYQWQAGSKRYPANISTVFLFLCGGETQGFGLGAGLYEQILENYKKETGKTNFGIPKDTQRKMWSLIVGLMKSVNDPRMGVPPHPDAGRSLMPILLDIVVNEKLAGRIDQQFVANLCHWALSWTNQGVDCPDLIPSGPGAHAAHLSADNSCMGQFDFVTGFWNCLDEYDNRIRSGPDQGGFWDPINNRWTLSTVKKLKIIPAGVLVVPPKTIKVVTQTLVAQSKAGLNPESEASQNKKKAALATSVVLGAGGFYLARRWAKKRKLRN